MKNTVDIARIFEAEEIAVRSLTDYGSASDLFSCFASTLGL